jgi:pimeloyl-ACP methyl ester carboxylesterase
MKLTPTLLAVLACLSLAAVLAAAALLVLNWATPSAPQLIAVENAQMAQLAQGAVRYEDRGHGSDAIVLLHGFNGQLGDWNQVWGMIGHCGRTIRIDAPGFGGSAWETADFTLQAQARRVVELLDALGVEQVTLVGTSMGGSLAAWIAAEHPTRVKSLLLLAPSGYPDSLHYEGLMGLLVKPGLANRVGQWIAQSRLYALFFPRSRALQATSVTASYGRPWAEALRRIAAPTLLIWSRGDTSFHAAPSVAALVKRSSLLPVAPEAGHLLLKTRPELAAAATCGLARSLSLEQVLDELRPVLQRTGDH